MKDFIAEFKAFAMRGNVIDLATAVVIGTAFGAIVSSLVTNIITPVMGILLGGIDFTGLSFSIGESEVTYGVFIQSVINFIIISFVVFVAIKVLTKLKNQAGEEPKQTPQLPSEEVLLLREIRDNLKR
jgi:large conductance mechanosensitive channel